MSNSLYDIPLNKIDGSESTLAEYQGQVALIVNVASKCGLTAQYEGLEKLYEKYKDQNFVVLGFPCNDFAGQEPGSEAEIQDFCTANFGVEFPMYSKVNVNSEPRHPLYTKLIDAKPEAEAAEGGKLKDALAKNGVLPKNETDVTWNFEKFLVGRDGSVLGRFAPDMTPEDGVLLSAIEGALAA
ncbi:MAG: glutathione peroxidase [Gammaproteobacteria bacterium]|nr:MAG: glutathione peroxidase [Gammaproteobacteria bacterium]RLA54328.1 MAG: glutathione peroxidase [Gammaproteobacteria bacterium]